MKGWLKVRGNKILWLEEAEYLEERRKGRKIEEERKGKTECKEGGKRVHLVNKERAGKMIKENRRKGRQRTKE